MMRKRKNKSVKMKEKNSLKKQIEEAVNGLYYISETDAEIFPFIGKKAETVNAETILKQTNEDKCPKIEEKSFEEFFERLTSHQDWFGEDEIETANKFSKLRELLEANLSELKVFKIGEVEIDIYVVGLDSDGRLTGIKTAAVET